MGPWDPAVIGPIAGAVMVVAISISIAGVMVFRPLTRQLGELLEQMRVDRRQRPALVASTRVAELMENVIDRLEQLEARQDFTERVIESAGWRGDSAASLSGQADPRHHGRTGWLLKRPAR